MKVFTLTVAAFWASLIWANDVIPPFPAKMEASVMEHAGEKLLVLGFENAVGWHTYWKNPGDAGLAMQFEFTQEGNQVALRELEWSAPHTYLEKGDITTYGYEKKYAFFFAGVDSLKPGPLTISAKWLICKHVCIPGQAKVDGSWPSDGHIAAAPGEFRFPKDKARNVLKKLPVESPWPDEFKLYMGQTGNPQELALHYQLKGVDEWGPGDQANLAFLFPLELLSFKKETLYRDGDTLYGHVVAEWNGDYTEPSVPFPADGTFATPLPIKLLLAWPDGPHRVIKKEILAFDTSSPRTINSFYKNLQKLKESKQLESQKTAATGIWMALLLAFLGGVILNFMPCVLPVISLKLFGLIKHKNLPRKTLLAHNFAYTAGVCATFLALGLVVVVLKRAGTEVGWGFQLQSPGFLLVAMGVIFAFALNLFGLFDFKTPFANRLGGIQLKDSLAGDFFAGILATLLSTPCSAPFLGTALTFALTTTTFNIFVTLFAVGLGLAFPFILTAVFPAAISFLPTPGNWMNTFKKFLAVTLLLTVVWLGSVYKSVAFPPQEVDIKNELGLDWQKWSQGRMKALRGQWVFIDFTADWCFTCKVNERLVLNTEGFKHLVDKHKIQLLLADWTRRNDAITQFLKSHNLVGVPAYFIQKPSGELVNLGETISLDKIARHLH